MIPSAAIDHWPHFWSPDLPQPPPRFHPLRVNALAPEDDQRLRDLPAGLHVLGDAHYSLAVAVSTTGVVRFAEFNRMRLRELAPSGEARTLLADHGGLYSVAFAPDGTFYFAVDSDSGDGRVVRFAEDGNHEVAFGGFNRPRQMTFGPDGKLYLVLEAAGKIVRWDPATGEVQDVVTGLRTPQGVAVGADGSVYYSSYSIMGNRGIALEPGHVGVLRPGAASPEVIARGFWRARGLALDQETGDLYLTTEANAWDQANSGLIVRITKGGEVETLLSGIDYPQFPCLGPDGALHVTLGRDMKLVAFNPREQWHTGPWPGTDPPLRVTTHGGTLLPEGTEGTRPIELKAGSLVLRAGIALANEAPFSAWVSIPAGMLDVSREELPYHTLERPTPGMFELPAVSLQCSGTVAHATAVALRDHHRSRWPMDWSTGREMPAPDFSETPIAYLVYLRVESGE